MKNILKIGLGILMLGMGINSCNKSQAKDHHHESGRCIGAKIVERVRLASIADTAIAVVDVECVAEKNGCLTIKL